MTSTDELTEREREWGSTMHGHRAAGVEVAHADSHAMVGAGRSLDREAREALEAESLRVGATRSNGAGRRLVDEAPDRTRTCFERDRDRILHATAFRRLAGKTQVFVFPDDHQRTRLTHALEVAQVARSVSRALGLNVPLTEAIALGHDCGHGPGGHASEEALAPSISPSGFDHAVWGADVTLTPLNLCARDARRDPQPLVVAAGTVHARGRGRELGRPHRLRLPRLRGRRPRRRRARPDELADVVLDRCGTSRRTQLAAFIAAMIDATERTGRIGMTTDQRRGARRLPARSTTSASTCARESREQAGG